MSSGRSTIVKALAFLYGSVFFNVALVVIGSLYAGHFRGLETWERVTYGAVIIAIIVSSFACIYMARKIVTDSDLSAQTYARVARTLSDTAKISATVAAAMLVLYVINWAALTDAERAFGAIVVSLPTFVALASYRGYRTWRRMI